MAKKLLDATGKCHEFVEEFMSTYRWNECVYSVKIGQPIQSPEFHTGLDRGLTWKLILTRINTCVKLYLTLVKSRNNIQIGANCKLYYSVQGSIVLNVIVKTISTSALFKVGGVIKLIEFSEPYKVQSISISISEEKKISVDNDLDEHLDQTKKLILDHLETLFLQTKFSDIVLIVSGVKLHAHKNILAARSEVFEAMFNHDMKENLQNSVTVDDAESGDVKEMLRFIYCGKVDNTRSSAKNLLALAEKYALSDLKALCESTLTHGLTKSNLIETLQIASLYRAEKLQNAAIDFIMRNDIGEEIDVKPLFESDPNLALKFTYRFNSLKK